mgnify:CR=1 FL=1
MWSVVGISEMKEPNEHTLVNTGGLTMEDELNLDGAITCACFDDTLDMVLIFSQKSKH